MKPIGQICGARQKIRFELIAYFHCFILNSFQLKLTNRVVVKNFWTETFLKQRNK